MAELTSAHPPPDRSAMAPRRHETAARMARQGRRRRAFGLAMMSLLGLSSAGLVGVFAYGSGMFTPEQKPAPAVPQAEVSRKSVRMTAPKVTGYDRKAQAYEINAESARQDDDEPHVVHMQKVTADLKLKKSDDTVRVVADEGIYDNDDETLKLAGNIVVTSASGYTARLEQASVWLKEGRIASDRPVTVTAPAGSIAANGLEMWNDGDNIRFLNRTRMMFKGDNRDAG